MLPTQPGCARSTCAWVAGMACAWVAGTAGVTFVMALRVIPAVMACLVYVREFEGSAPHRGLGREAAVIHQRIAPQLARCRILTDQHRLTVAQDDPLAGCG